MRITEVVRERNDARTVRQRRSAVSRRVERVKFNGRCSVVVKQPAGIVANADYMQMRKECRERPETTDEVAVPRLSI